MAYNTPFQPYGQTVSLQTSGSASTAQSRQITAANFGLDRLPPMIRVINRGTADIWISFTNAQTTIAIPTPGTTTAGTPQACFLIVPGVVEIFVPNAGPQLFVNDISTGTSNVYHLTGGEGS